MPAERRSTTEVGSSHPHRSFECEICLDEPLDPVLTLCGHPFCWSCLYRWLQTDHNQCPVCKSLISVDRIIPVYGHNHTHRNLNSRHNSVSQDDRGAAPSEGSVIPPRPSGQRVEPPTASDDGNMEDDYYPDLPPSPLWGFFPSIFSLLLQSINSTRPRGSSVDMTTRQQIFLERVIVSFGLLIFFLMIFL